MLLPRPLYVLAVPLALVFLVAACGGGDEIPPKTGTALVRNLDTIEQGVRAGECERTRATLRRLERRVESLPSTVDRDLRSSLDRGVEHLGRLFKTQCKQKPEPVEPVVPPPVVTTPEPPQVQAPEEPQVQEPEAPQVQEPEKPERPEKPEKPKADEPKEEEKDICGENPAPEC